MFTEMTSETAPNSPPATLLPPGHLHSLRSSASGTQGRLPPLLESEGSSFGVQAPSWSPKEP